MDNILLGIIIINFGVWFVAYFTAKTTDELRAITIKLNEIVDEIKKLK